MNTVLAAPSKGQLAALRLRAPDSERAPRTYARSQKAARALARLTGRPVPDVALSAATPEVTTEMAVRRLRSAVIQRRQVRGTKAEVAFVLLRGRAA